MVIETAERTGDVRALLLLHLEHQVPDIPRHGIHPQSVKSPFKHMGLDAGLMEGCRPLAYRHIGVLPKKKVNLLESASISLNPVETTHIDDRWSDLAKLIHPRDIFARALPHVPVHQGELYLFSHMNNSFKLQIYSFFTIFREFSDSNLRKR